MVRFNVELKPPRLFGKKDKDEKNQMEVSVNDKKISETHLMIGGTLVVGLTIGYLVGFNRGVNKNTNMYIIK